MEETRISVEKEFKDSFDEASTLAKELEVELKLPRRCPQQKHRANVEAATVEEYYR